MAVRNSRKVQRDLIDGIDRADTYVKEANEANPRNHHLVRAALAEIRAELETLKRVLDTSYNQILDGLEAEISDRDGLIANYEALLAQHGIAVPDSVEVLRLVKEKRARREKRRRLGT